MCANMLRPQEIRGIQSFPQIYQSFPQPLWNTQVYLF